MGTTLKDRLAGNVPGVDDPIWQNLPKWLEGAAPLSETMQTALTIAHLQSGLDTFRLRKARGLTSFVQSKDSYPLLHRLADDLRVLKLEDAAKMAEELPAMFRVETLPEIPGRTRENQENETLWDNVARVSKRMAEVDTASALWGYLQSQKGTEEIDAELPKGFFARLFGG